MKNYCLAKHIAMLCCGSALLLQSCSSAITSEQFKNTTNPTEVTGLIYHMPKRAIRLDVTIADPPASDSANKAATSTPSTSSSVSNAVSFSDPSKQTPSGNAKDSGPSCAATASYCEITKTQTDAKGKKTSTINITKIVTTDPTKTGEGKPKQLTVTLTNNWATET